MKLAPKVIGSILLANFIVLTVTFQLQNSIFDRVLKEVDQDSASSLGLQIDTGIRLLKRNLNAKIKDWANWDDAYELVSHPDSNTKFLQNNFKSQAMLNVGVQYLAVFDLNHEMLFNQYISQDGKSVETIPGEIVDKIAVWRKTKWPEDFIEFIPTSRGIALIHLKAIRDTEMKQPPMGALLMGFELSGEIIAGVESILGIPFVIKSIDSNVKSNLVSYKIEDEMIQYAKVYEEGASRPVFSVSSQASLPLRKFVKSNLIYFQIGAIMIIIFSTIAMLFAIFKFVLIPIRKIKEQVPLLFDLNSKSQVFVDTKDEFFELSQTMNSAKDLHVKFSEKLIQSQKKLAHSAKKSAIGDMSTGVAHEVNNPLAIAKTRIQMIVHRLQKKSVSNEELIVDLEKVDSSLQRISKIVSLLVGVSGGDGTESLSVEPIEKVLEQAMDLCRQKLANAGIKLIYKPGLEFKANIKRIELVQAFLSLITNSIEAIEDLNDRWIRIEVSSLDGFIYVKIIDSGFGIPAEIQEHMMDIFFSTKELGEGSGLGLAITQKLAKELGGNLLYELIQGHTCFVFVLPESK